MENPLENLKESTKAAQGIIDGTDNPDANYLLLRYVNSILVERVDKALEYLRPRIEERHKVEAGETDFFTAIHYTGINVFVSMLEKAAKQENENSLRMYDSVHLNDPDEGNYFSRNLPEEYDWLKRKDVSHAYIASFITPNSEKDMSDNLVFWRTYGKEGLGCSLSVFVPPDRLKKVLYGPGKKRGKEGVEGTVKILKPVLDCLDPLVTVAERRLRENIREALAKRVWKFLERFRYLYKSEAHEYEEECRLVLVESDIAKPEDEIRFEDGNGETCSPSSMRHYCVDKDLSIGKLLPSGSLITLGPCVPYSYNVRYYLEVLKKKAKLLGRPEIRISRIPYRKP